MVTGATTRQVFMHTNMTKKRKQKKPTVKKTSETSEIPEQTLSPKQQEIKDRQEKVYRMMLRGFTQAQMSEMFGVTERQIADDVKVIKGQIQQRSVESKQWGQDSYAQEKLEELRQMKADFYTVRTESGMTPSAKVQAMMGMMVAIERETKILEKMGLLPKDSLEEEFRQPVNVIFNIKRPDRTKQLAEQEKNRTNAKTKQ